MNSRFLAVVLAAIVAGSALAVPMAGLAVADHASSPTDDTTINYQADPAPDIRAHAGNVQITEHDRAVMDGPLEYYTDDGEVKSLAADGAEMNSSVEAPIGVNLSHVKDDRMTAFPRLSSEDGNGASWTNSGNWTTTSSTSGGMTVSGGTVDGSNVSSVTFAATAGSASEYGQASYSRVDVTSDATKRVAQVGMNVQSLGSGAVVQVRFEDGDGDFVALAVNQSGNPVTNESVITNSTGTAFVSQERLNNLAIQGNGDGTLDGIQNIRVRGMDADATVEIFWLDAEKKSTEEIVDLQRDTDSDGEDEWTAVVDKYESGIAWTTGLDTLPEWSNDAVIFDLVVDDVTFPLENVADSHNNISLTDHPTYDGGALEGYWRHTVPAQIDLSYGNLTLLATPTVQADRYETFGYATNIGSDTDMVNVSYTDATGTLSEKGKTYILVSNLNAGEEWSAHLEQPLTVENRDALTDTTAAGGPVNGGGGGIFSSIWGKIVGGVMAVASVVFGGRRLFGGS
jgi:hypothetical protein